MAQERAHEEGQQHPLSFTWWSGAGCFVLSTCSYLVDYFGLEGYLRWSLILLFMVVKARLDRRYFHAHGVGAAGTDVCHSGSSGRGVAVCGDHGVRIGLHALHADHIFRNGER